MWVFVQPVVDAFDPRLLVAQPIIHVIDFLTAKVFLVLFPQVVNVAI